MDLQKQDSLTKIVEIRKSVVHLNIISVCLNYLVLSLWNNSDPDGIESTFQFFKSPFLRYS